MHPQAHFIFVGREAHDGLRRDKFLSGSKRPVEHEIVDADEHARDAGVVCLEDLFMIARIHEVEGIHPPLVFRHHEGVVHMRRGTRLRVVDEDAAGNGTDGLVPLTAPCAFKGNGVVIGAREVELQAHQPADADLPAGSVDQLRRYRDDVAVVEYRIIEVKRDARGRIHIFEFQRFPLSVRRRERRQLRLFREHPAAGKGKIGGKPAVGIEQQYAAFRIFVVGVSAVLRKDAPARAAVKLGARSLYLFAVIEVFCRVRADHKRRVGCVQTDDLSLLSYHVCLRVRVWEHFVHIFEYTIFFDICILNGGLFHKKTQR